MHKNDFKNPGVEFRGKPFWAWNGKLDKDEVKRQVRILKEMGFGGSFMHSRTGLHTPYLSNEWFDIVKTAIDESKANACEAWLYDEDRWPSGSAGGLLTKTNPKYRRHYLYAKLFSEHKLIPTDGRYKSFYLLKLDSDNKILYSYKKFNPEKEQLPEGFKVLAWVMREEAPSSWYNGSTYIDMFSADAVKAFIKLTHEAYYKHFGKDFGKSIPAIFTDEPNYGQSYGHFTGAVIDASIPWSEKLPVSFKKAYGYDILARLPELFFSLSEDVFSKTKHDYREHITELFSKNFAGQIGKWCEKHGFALTGHVLCEESLLYQTGVVGSAMRSSQYFQMPGIDILCAEGIDNRNGNQEPEYLTAKQCASVKEQFGRKWMLSELYGCTGWHFTFAEHKAVGDWQAALGVNLRCQHLAWYTMEGEAKRDYPASIFYQSPWWKDYKYVEDYFSRVNMLLTEGKAVRDLAVIHPIESTWGTLSFFEPKETDPRRSFDKMLKEVQKILLEEHFDFDYVDEAILAEHGSVKGGKLNVAKASYTTVIVPPMETIRESTLACLEKLQKAGALVIFVEPVADYLNAEKNDKLKSRLEKFKRIQLERNSITKLLADDKNMRRVSISTADGKEYPHVIYQFRYDAKKKKTILFLCHTTQKQSSGKLTVTVPAEGFVNEYNCIVGDIYQYSFRKNKDTVSFEVELEPYGSAMFAIESEKAGNNALHTANAKETGRLKFDSEDWLISRDEPNAFPLDYPKHSINGGEYQPEADVLTIDIDLRAHIGVPSRGGHMCQPWAAKNESSKVKADLKLKYQFYVDVMPSSPCNLVIERPSDFKITLNGFSLNADDDEGWWIDKSFRKLKVSPSMLKPGLNELILETVYTPASGLESMYFTGEFGMKWIDNIAHITDLPETLKIGSWLEQGFPTYSGAITYKNTFKASENKKQSYILTLPDWRGALLKIRVNGIQAGILAWPPYKLDISSLVKAGELNSIEIELVSTRKNLLGPLHHTTVYPVWTGPGQFLYPTSQKKEEWNKSYLALPYGLMDAPYITIAGN